MRRNYRRNGDGLDNKKMLYITGTIFALAVIAFVITFFIYGNTLNKNNELSRINSNTLGTITATEETSTSYGKTVDEMQNTVENTEKIAVNTSIMEEETDNKKQNEEKVDTSNEQTTNKNTEEENKTSSEQNSEDEINTKTEKEPEFVMPVAGDIMKEFADNKLVYSSTLDVWTTHNGIDIAADKTTVVKASAEGKIQSIKNDPRYGITIIIEHSSGYKTVYSNLLSTEFVVEGEQVEQGQSIGTVGNSATFEVADEPHLHFEILKNNEQVDPELYLK